MQLLKSYKEAFWDKVYSLKAQLKQHDIDFCWNEKRKSWKDRVTRGRAIVTHIVLANELKRMIG